MLQHEGSTRPAALVRIGLVFLVWSRFGNELILVRSLEPDRVVLGFVFFLVTTLFALGAATRVTGALTALVLVVMSYGYGQHWGVSGWKSHHVVLLVHGAVLLAMSPSGRSYSVDRWLALRRAERSGLPAPAERGPTWALTLLAVQVSSVYLWAAIDKTTWGFLSGQRLEMIFMHLFFGSDYPPFPGFRALCTVSAVITVLLQYALAFGLFVKPLRRWLIPLGIALHVGFYYLMPITVFSATMILFYLAYVDPDAVHRAIDRMQTGSSPRAGEPATVERDAA